jgi:hypothetical protein
MDRHEHANLVKIKYVILFQRALSYVLSYIYLKKKKYLLGAHFWQVTSLIWRWGLRLLGFPKIYIYIGTPKSSILNHLDTISYYSSMAHESYEGFHKIGVPPNHPFIDRIFHKPSILGSIYGNLLPNLNRCSQGIAVPARAVPWATQIFAMEHGLKLPSRWLVSTKVPTWYM